VALSGLQGIGHIPYRRDEYWESVCAYLGVEVPTKEELYQKLGYIPLPKQVEIHSDRHTHRIIAGGNRGGKTQTLAWEIIPYLIWPKTKGWVVCRNYSLADITRRKLEEILKTYAGMKAVSRLSQLAVNTFYYSAKTYTLYLWTGSKLGFKSAENDNAMHGEDLDYIVVDEASLFPFVLYDTRLIPRLVDNGGGILSAGTFESLQGEWFEEYYVIGQEENDDDLRSWKMPTRENYHVYTAVGGETAAHVAKRYRINWRKLTKDNPEAEWPMLPGQQVTIYNVDLKWLEKERTRIDPKVFKARYEAEPASNQFLVFPKWSIQRYGNSKLAEFDPELPVYLAVDPGGTYAVAAIQIKYGRTENRLTKGAVVAIIDELYVQTTITTEEMYEMCREREWFPNLRRDIFSDQVQGAIDVVAKEQARAWNRIAQQDPMLGGLNLRMKRVKIDPGSKTLQHYLDTDSLVVNPKKCPFFNLEMKRYHYPELSMLRVDSGDPRRVSNPVDEWNHLVKAVIYFLVVQFGLYRESDAPAKRTRADAQDSGPRRLRVLST
jgi:hypothetical protein